jgi:nucleotide-binding universal stress UspA family protein
MKIEAAAVRGPAEQRGAIMLKSILLYLENSEQAAPVIELGVSFAKETEARVRGLTLVDTRRFDAAQDCESAIYMSMAQSRHTYAECVQENARAELSQACLKARLNFDVRRIAGNPLELLPAESQFHDLTITAFGDMNRRLPPGTTSTLSPSDMLQLLQLGVQPLLVLPQAAKPIERVLLVYDGSDAAGRAIRSYLNFGVLRNADHRLLAIGATQTEARASLAEMAEYCSSHCRTLETGCAVGRVRRVLVPYATKWEADLLVLGVCRGNGWIRRVFGQPSIDLARTLKCGLLVQA